jgi:hypothetical protein
MKLLNKKSSNFSSQDYDNEGIFQENVKLRKCKLC